MMIEVEPNDAFLWGFVAVIVVVVKRPEVQRDPKWFYYGKKSMKIVTKHQERGAIVKLSHCNEIGTQFAWLQRILVL